MPKTKDAFALKDFDDSRILQRKFFERDNLYRQARAGGNWQYDLPTGSDNYIVDRMCSDIIEAFECDNYERGQDKLDRFNLRLIVVDRYMTCITRHLGRLRRYMTLRDGDARLNELVAKYQVIADAILWVKGKFVYCLEDIEHAKRRYKQIFATRLREVRLKKKLTQTQISQMLGVAQTAYSSYEKMTREPSLTTLVRISKILNCSVDWLLGLNK